MAMNTGGQIFLIGIMLGILGFMAAMVFIDPIADVITEARGVDQLDCTNSSISDGHKMTCLLVDLTLPGFIGIIIGVAGALVSAKFIG